MSDIKAKFDCNRLQDLFYERAQLTVDVCQILWRQHELDGEIRTLLEACTSSQETRDELARLCHAKAQARLHGELWAATDAA